MKVTVVPRGKQARLSPNPRELKERADFVAIASWYGLRLRRAGDQLRALCPFHSERHPSFYLRPERKIFHCFGCERGGDVFAFVMLAEYCDFSSALRIVCDFSSGVARESERRSRERVRAREGAKPLARAAGAQHSQNSRAAILAALDATEARLVAIRAANDAAAMEFATACEPCDGDGSLLLVNKRISGHE